MAASTQPNLCFHAGAGSELLDKQPSDEEDSGSESGSGLSGTSPASSPDMGDPVSSAGPRTAAGKAADEDPSPTKRWRAESLERVSHRITSAVGGDVCC